MRHYLQSLFVLLMALICCRGGYAQSWEKTDLTALSSSDVFLIVDLTSKTAINSSNGTKSAPTAVSVTLSDDQSSVTGDVADELKWNVSSSGNGYVFYPNGSTTTWLYCTNNNNGVRVGTGTDKTFTAYSSGNYSGLYNTGQKRYVGVYNKQDWRCYTSSTGNIASTSIAYFKYTEGSSSKTSTTLSFPQSSVTYNTLDDLTAFKGQTATLTAGEETLTGKTITYSKSGDDIFSSFNESTGELALSGTAGTATVTAKFDGTDDDTYASSSASYTVTVDQVIKDIATLKPLVTSTSSSKQDVFKLKLTDAIVTYRSGNNLYIEDVTGGLYSSAAGMSWATGDKVNGVVTVKVYKNQGQTQVNSITIPSEVTVEHDVAFTPATVTIAQLNADIDKYENMRVKVVGATVNAKMSSYSTTITQDDATITLYDKGKNTWSLAAGDEINVEGYPCTYNKTKELCIWIKGDVTVNESKVATTLSFDPATTEYTVEKGKESSFTAPKAVVTDANNETVADAKVTYKSSNTDVATIAEDGTLTFVAVGTTTITASYAGDDSHKAAADVSYTIIYNKVKPTMTWSATEVTANIGETFTAPTLTLTAGNEDILSGKTVTYTSSNTDVATVADNGAVTIVGAEGTTTVTATFAGDDTYAEASASYVLTVSDPSNLTATFDFLTPSKYGYGVSSSSSTAGDVAEGAKLTEGEVTLTNTTKAGTGTRFWEDGLRTYKGNTHTLSVPAGYRITSVAFVGGNKASYSYTIGDAEKNTSWTGSAKILNIVYDGTTKVIESLTVTYKKVTLPAVELTEQSNDDAILDNADEYVNVTVSRTLIADGGWYTLCLPFDVDDIAATPLKDAEMRQYKSMSGSTMNFEATTALKAMHAYLVKPTVDITNPVFEDVKMVIEGDNVKDGSDGYEFVGTYSATKLKTDGTNLFLGAENKFYVPTADDCTLKALRGYFVVPEGTNASKMAVNVDGETTLVTRIDGAAMPADGKVYTLSGQLVGTNALALPKGVYIVNGKKYISK